MKKKKMMIIFYDGNDDKSNERSNLDGITAFVGAVVAAVGGTDDRPCSNMMMNLFNNQQGRGMTMMVGWKWDDDNHGQRLLLLVLTFDR